MPIRNSRDQWGAVSIALHWLTLLLILGMATVGLLMVEMDNGPAKIQVYALHKSFGLTVLGLTVLRLAWRLAVGTPRPVPGTPHVAGRDRPHDPWRDVRAAAGGAAVRLVVQFRGGLSAALVRPGQIAEADRLRPGDQGTGQGNARESCSCCWPV